MKRLAILFLAAGLLFGGATSAKAVDLSASGYWQFGWTWADNSVAKNDTADTFKPTQRMRTEFKFTASENLSALVGLEIGTGFWGSSDWGAGYGMGLDSVSTKVRLGYVDWTVPGLDTKVRMGLHCVSTPAYGFLSVLSYADMAGITANHQFNDNVGLTLGWYRPYNASTSTPHDTVDVFLLSVPVKGDGYVLNPWGMYAQVGTSALNSFWGSGNGSEINSLEGLLPAGVAPTKPVSDKTRGGAWWLALGGKLDMFSPLTVAGDILYGSADFGKDTKSGIDMKRAGWMASLIATYKLDNFTPGLLLWYASGDDSDPYDGSERIPTIWGDSWGTHWGQDAGWFDAATIGTSMAGSWGAGVRFDDISFMDKVSSNLRFTYYQGTNSKEMARGTAFVATQGADRGYLSEQYGMYLTKGDKAFEVNFLTYYKIYDNMTLHLDLGYMKFNLDDAVWTDNSERDDKMYKIGLYATYAF